jgi:hypothetical protein
MAYKVEFDYKIERSLMFVNHFKFFFLFSLTAYVTYYPHCKSILKVFELSEDLEVAAMYNEYQSGTTRKVNIKLR